VQRPTPVAGVDLQRGLGVEALIFTLGVSTGGGLNGALEEDYLLGGRGPAALLALRIE
jgi:hypothetical protein